MDDIAPSLAPAPPETDRILEYLIGLNMVEYEMSFRMTLQTLCVDDAPPGLRELAIATVAQLMSLGGISWQLVLCAINHLRKLDDIELKTAAVALVNGAVLYLPAPNEGMKVYDAVSLRQVVTPEDPPLVSTIYSLTAVWDKLHQILG